MSGAVGCRVFGLLEGAESGFIGVSSDGTKAVNVEMSGRCEAGSSKPRLSGFRVAPRVSLNAGMLWHSNSSITHRSKSKPQNRQHDSENHEAKRSPASNEKGQSSLNSKP